MHPLFNKQPQCHPWDFSFLHKSSLFFCTPCDSVSLSFSALSLSLHCCCLLVEVWAVTVQTQGSWREEIIQRGAAMKAPLRPSVRQGERKAWREPTMSRWVPIARRTWRTVILWHRSDSSRLDPEQRDWASALAQPGPWPSLEKIVLVQRWSSTQWIWGNTQVLHVWMWKHRWVNQWSWLPVSHVWP